MLSAKVYSFISSKFGATHKSQEAKNQVASGNVKFAKSIIEVKNSCAYRVDTRSPETIRKNGFTGTHNSDPLEVRVFGDKTVFASGNNEGLKTFIKSHGFIHDAKTSYVYKINTSGHKVFSFAKNFKENPGELIAGVAQLAAKELALPQEEAIEMAAQALHDDYLAVDELQIQGPIKPENIEHIDTVELK